MQMPQMIFLSARKILEEISNGGFPIPNFARRRRMADKMLEEFQVGVSLNPLFFLPKPTRPCIVPFST